MWITQDTRTESPLYERIRETCEDASIANFLIAKKPDGTRARRHPFSSVD
jgi:hypothetical protein